MQSIRKKLEWAEQLIDRNKMGILIIAEAGVNHNGDLFLAKKMVDAAKEAGADVVKFQTFRAGNMISKYAPKAAYQEETTGKKENQLDMVKKLELSEQEFVILKEHCVKKEIGFLSTPFDIESIGFLNQLGVPLWKIPSGEITNLPYLIEIAKTGKDIILSTGMSTMEEIEKAMLVLKEYGSGGITLLHCNTQYPTPYCDVNLKAMNQLKSEFNVKVGYSDHTMGMEVSVAAAAMGAAVIEKHFTLDQNMEGPDHKASLIPEQLKEMIRMIRNVENALGDGKKKVTASEAGNRHAARKSIVAKRNIQKGELLTQENITVKRPGNGISPMEWFQVLNTRAVENFAEDEQISLEGKESK